jgi:L-ascorbate metabolism protein UlaG (beta-lactamase superfamily)
LRKTILLTIFLGAIMTSCTTKHYNSKHFKDGVFVNEETPYNSSISQIPSILYDFIFYKSKDATPKKEIPVIKLSTKDLEELEDYSVIRFAHSTLLFKFEGKFILTDPVFGERASPFSYLGPKKFHKMPISIEELPFIDSVIISHNHYDHLDEYSIEKLKDKVGKFYTTLGVGAKLISLGVKKENIIELDWWEKESENNINYICTPAQHFSGRGLFDRDKTLWSSWVIEAPKAKVYFGADGGYFDGFKEIGWNYGPFDMSFLEVGAYNKKWKEIHMMPKESVQAHIDLNAKVMFPIHNGSFDLALHSWYDPFEKVDIEASEKNIDIIYPKMGESISILKKNSTTKWWRDL